MIVGSCLLSDSFKTRVEVINGTGISPWPEVLHSGKGTPGGVREELPQEALWGW